MSRATSPVASNTSMSRIVSLLAAIDRDYSLHWHPLPGSSLFIAVFTSDDMARMSAHPEPGLPAKYDTFKTRFIKSKGNVWGLRCVKPRVPGAPTPTFYCRAIFHPWLQPGSVNLRAALAASPANAKEAALDYKASVPDATLSSAARAYYAALRASGGTSTATPPPTTPAAAARADSPGAATAVPAPVDDDDDDATLASIVDEEAADAVLPAGSWWEPEQAGEASPHPASPLPAMAGALLFGVDVDDEEGEGDSVIGPSHPLFDIPPPPSMHLPAQYGSLAVDTSLPPLDLIGEAFAGMCL